jgi:hypothetical protein
MRTRLLFLVTLLSFSIVAQAWAHSSASNLQQTVGELRVEVRDPAGKVIEAPGNLDSLTNGVSRIFQTDSHSDDHTPAFNHSPATHGVVVNPRSRVNPALHPHTPTIIFWSTL